MNVDVPFAMKARLRMTYFAVMVASAEVRRGFALRVMDCWELGERPWKWLCTKKRKLSSSTSETWVLAE
ncbi:MAG: hypothetical protein NTY83_00495 [Candidatus Micrarchaeota archaeon]|nr:hypothetical protein [Candidatus Micrarchaeota archaeon]